MFHCMDYNASAAAAGASNTDFHMVTDTIFSQNNNHLLTTDELYIRAISLVGASVTQGRFQSPAFNAQGEFNIFSANRALQPPSNPLYDLYDRMPILIPPGEEIQVQASNNLGAATEIENAVIVVQDRNHKKTIPTGYQPLCARATFTVTPTLNGWSGAQAITFGQRPRSGVYTVVGAECQGSNIVAFRLIFPRQKLIHGRAWRPGHLSQNAIGDVTNLQVDPWTIGWGEWGRFWTFEPPSVEVLGTAASSTTYTLFLWLIQLSQGNDQTPLDSWVNTPA